MKTHKFYIFDFMSLLYDLLGYGLPDFETIDEYLDFLYPHIRYFGEDLAEMDFYLEKQWKEVQENSNDIVVRIFKPSLTPQELGTSVSVSGSNYMRIVNGAVSEGVWGIIETSNTLLIHFGGKYELFDLVFLDSNFFIFKKHRNQHTPIEGQKYILLVKEGGDIKGLMEALYDNYRDGMAKMTLLVLVLIIGVLGVVIFFAI